MGRTENRTCSAGILPVSPTNEKPIRTLRSQDSIVKICLFFLSLL